MDANELMRNIIKYDLTDLVESQIILTKSSLRRGKQMVLCGHPRSCGNTKPHVPHVVGTYKTVRFGQLQYFCPGKAGDGLEITKNPEGFFVKEE